MSRHPRAALAALLSIALLGGATATIAQSGGSPLTANPWSLVSLDGEAVPPAAGVTGTFADDGTLTGSGGCNNYSSTYTTDGDVLTIEPVLAGRKSCGDPTDSRENAFFAMLEAADAFAISGGTLTITTADGATLVMAAPGGLVGAWALTSINGTPIPATLTATAVFGDDDTVTGSGGCNAFNGTYTADGDAIAMGELRTTRKACAANVMAVESAYLDALQVVTRFAASGATLTLSDTAGAVELQLASTGAVAPTPGPAESQAPSGTIVGPTWRITDFAGAPLGGLFTVTATFGTDGVMSGNGGCNDYTADYTLTGDSLAITNVVIGTKVCPGTGGTIEQGYTSVLPFVDSLTLDGATLVMASSLASFEIRFEVAP